MPNKYKRPLKGELTFRLLSLLENTAYALGDLFYGFTLPYGTPLGKALRELEKRQANRGSWASMVSAKLQEKNRFHKFLYKLKRDGLIDSDTKGKIKLTEKGKLVLKKLRGQTNLLSTMSYAVETSPLWYVVIFDIPENARQKRAWLRAALRSLEFEMIQKSVWVGNTRLPADFLNDLSKLKLVDCVHIFSINKPGSISDLTKLKPLI